MTGRVPRDGEVADPPRPTGAARAARRTGWSCSVADAALAHRRHEPIEVAATADRGAGVRHGSPAVVPAWRCGPTCWRWPRRCRPRRSASAARPQAEHVGCRPAPVAPALVDARRDRTPRDRVTRRSRSGCPRWVSSAFSYRRSRSPRRDPPAPRTARPPSQEASIAAPAVAFGLTTGAGSQLPISRFDPPRPPRMVPRPGRSRRCSRRRSGAAGWRCSRFVTRPSAGGRYDEARPRQPYAGGTGGRARSSRQRYDRSTHVRSPPTTPRTTDSSWRRWPIVAPMR